MNNSIKIQEELERKILRGISMEWDQALELLDYTHQTKMDKPLFNIKSMKKRLGYWDREKREICLSRSLVLDHSWDSVCDVLRHEMAHQFNDEVFKTLNETSHGPSFKKACFLLRADPEASGRYKTLHQRIAEDSANDDDRIVLKIRKLMALAQSKNTHEAQAAMAKAHQLIVKFNVDLWQNNARDDYVSIFLGSPCLRHTKDHYFMSNLLIGYYFVDGIWMTAYVCEKEKLGRVLEISGTRRNVSIASYVYDFIRRYIDLQWQEYNKDKRMTLHRKTDFAVGIIRGFEKKLKTQKDVQSPETNALIKAGDPGLVEYFNYRYPSVRSFNRRGTTSNPQVIKDGEAAGKKMVISQGIEGKESKIGLLE